MVSRCDQTAAAEPELKVTVVAAMGTMHMGHRQVLFRKERRAEAKTFSISQ